MKEWATAPNPTIIRWRDEAGRKLVARYDPKPVRPPRSLEALDRHQEKRRKIATKKTVWSNFVSAKFKAPTYLEFCNRTPFCGCYECSSYNYDDYVGLAAGEWGRRLDALGDYYRDPDNWDPRRYQLWMPLHMENHAPFTRHMHEYTVQYPSGFDERIDSYVAQDVAAKAALLKWRTEARGAMPPQPPPRDSGKIEIGLDFDLQGFANTHNCKIIERADRRVSTIDFRTNGTPRFNYRVEAGAPRREFLPR
jgi:hypothetical protein